MATVPPQGMNEGDYAAIEAAVTETVRGRWFLNEFARRNRTVELRQLMEAMGRIESVVTAGHAALSPADPSIRLLMQRIKEIAGQLDMLSYDMREAGIDERFAAAAEKQASAVSGLMRGTGAMRPPGVAHAPAEPKALSEAPKALAEPVKPLAEAVPETALAQAPSRVAEPHGGTSVPKDPRLTILAPLDAMPIEEKLALFA